MKLKSWIGPVLGLAALLVFLLIPPIEPLTEKGMKVVGIFLFTIVWWTTVGVGYPSLIAIALLAITGVMTPEDVYAASWGHWLVVFLIGVYGLTKALSESGISKRFALWFVNRPFNAGHPWRLVGMFLLSCFLVGSFMTSVATCAIFMAIAQPMLNALGYKKGDRFSAMLMMGIAWSATAGSVTTPIAHPINLMMMDFLQRDFGYKVTFLQWMVFGVPMGLLTFAGFWTAFRYIVRPDVSKVTSLATDFLKKEAKALGAIKLEEKLAVIIFLAVIICWLLPGIPGNFLLPVKNALDRMGYAVPALIGAGALCLIKVKGTPLLTFQRWVVDGVEWGTVTLSAAVFAIGAVIGDPGTGIPEFMTNIFQPIAHVLPLYGVVVLSLLWLVTQTNVMSNMVSVILVYTVMMPIFAAIGVGNPIALGTALSGASYFALSLPSATAVTAIAAGSGWVPTSFMARYGLLFIVPIVLLFSFVHYPIASAVFSGAIGP